MKDLLYYTFIRRIEAIPILNYFPYDQKQVDEFLAKDCCATIASE